MESRSKIAHYFAYILYIDEMTNYILKIRTHKIDESEYKSRYNIQFNNFDIYIS
jgi:hypothetical protein